MWLSGDGSFGWYVTAAAAWADAAKLRVREADTARRDVVIFVASRRRCADVPGRVGQSRQLNLLHTQVPFLVARRRFPFYRGFSNAYKNKIFPDRLNLTNYV